MPSILIVEDNPDLREHICEALEEHYTIIEAMDGQDGVEKALEQVPDLVISDVMMPRKDGFELCETLKKEERTSHVPIILLTAKVGTQNRITGWKTGADEYMVKPFSIEELLSRIENLLDIRRSLQKRNRNFALLPPEQTAPASPGDIFLQKVTETIRENISSQSFDMELLCHATGMSRTPFFQKFKSLTGQSPAQFVKEVRMKQAMHLLQATEKRIAEVAYETGFGNPASFTNSFTKHFGKAPSEVRKAN